MSSNDAAARTTDFGRDGVQSPQTRGGLSWLDLLRLFTPWLCTPWLCLLQPRPIRLAIWTAASLLCVPTLGWAAATSGGDSAAVSEAPDSSDSALRIRAGSIATDQVVAIGRSLIIEGDALRDAAAIQGDARVLGRVRGDLIVLGGNAVLHESASVEGDVFVLGGEIDLKPGAEVGGRSVSYPSANAAWLTLIEGPSIGMEATSPLVIGAKLALLTAWLSVTLLLLASSGREVLVTSEVVREESIRCFFVGVTAVLTLFLTALFLTVLTSAIVGVPLLFLTVLFALLLKIWGLVAVFHSLGFWAVGAGLGRRLTPLNAAAIGLIGLGLVKLIPLVGVWLWTMATFVGVGGALITKFGRREPWFSPDELERMASMS